MCGRTIHRSAKPDVLHSCAKSPAQTRTLAKRESMCSEMSHELFHPTCKTHSAMPLTIRSTTQNGSARAARQALLSEAAARSGPLEPKLGTQNACVRSERQAAHLQQMRTAPRSKARDANRNRQERAPSPPFSADATGQAFSKKARALARIRPFTRLLRR